MKKYILFILLTSICSYSQIGTGTTAPEGALEVNSANNGFLIPRIALTSTLDATTVINPETPLALVKGTLVYNTATNGISPNNVTPGMYSWNTNSWSRLENSTSSLTTLSSTVNEPDFTYSTTSLTGTQSTAVTLNDQNTTRVVSATGFSGNVINVTCNVKLGQERYAADTNLYLQSPAGKIIELVCDNAASPDNFANNNIPFDVTFSDLGATNVTTWDGLLSGISGTYKPKGTLTAGLVTPNITTMAGFNGDTPNGNWTLYIRDKNNGNGRELNFISYTINITTAIPTNYRLVNEVPIIYKENNNIIINSTYSANSSDNEGVLTAITQSTTSAGAVGTVVTNLTPYNKLSFAAESPFQGTGNYWLSLFNQATQTNGLVDGTTYYYQLWVKGNIETPTASNEQYSIIPMQIQK